MPKGIVLKSTGKFYSILLDSREHKTAIIRGKVRLHADKSTNPVAVGDRVEVDYIKDDPEIMSIKSVFPRQNYLVRKATNLSKRQQVLASNIDRIYLVVTIKNPVTQYGFIDRFLVSAESFRIPVSLLFNKMDILSQDDKDKQGQLADIYSKIGYRCHFISSHHYDSIKFLKKEIEGKQVLFAGNSGVGKSTLINALDPTLNLKTNEISKTHLQGKHTTTFAEMHRIKSGGFLIDSPGIKAFGLVDLKKEVISHYFPEMRVLLNNCKYNNCLHLKEPNCAIKKALENKEIHPNRYATYQQIMVEDQNNVYRKNSFL